MEDVEILDGKFKIDTKFTVNEVNGAFLFNNNYKRVGSNLLYTTDNSLDDFLKQLNLKLLEVADKSHDLGLYCTKLLDGSVRYIVALNRVVPLFMISVIYESMFLETILDTTCNKTGTRVHTFIETGSILANEISNEISMSIELENILDYIRMFAQIIINTQEYHEFIKCSPQGFYKFLRVGLAKYNIRPVPSSVSVLLRYKDFSEFKVNNDLIAFGNNFYGGIK